MLVEYCFIVKFALWLVAAVVLLVVFVVFVVHVFGAALEAPRALQTNDFALLIGYPFLVGVNASLGWLF